MKKTKNYRQCSKCGYVDDLQRLRCQKCEGAMYPYRNTIGVRIKEVINGVVYFNI